MALRKNRTTLTFNIKNKMLQGINMLINLETCKMISDISQMLTTTLQKVIQ